MRGDHGEALLRAKQELLRAALDYSRCRAYSNKEILRLAIEALGKVSGREDDLEEHCPYCGRHNGYDLAQQRRFLNCDCFEGGENE